MFIRVVAAGLLCSCGHVATVDAGLSVRASLDDSGTSAAVEVADAGAQGVVATAHGWVRGQRVGETWSFKGIPYASAERWKPPVDPAAWSTTLDALAFGPPCPQHTSDGGIAGTEDCLTLNVWTPTAKPSGGAPVLVFVHGGAHHVGASSSPVYDGRALSEFGGVVVVTLNYRLGALGFLAHPALGVENASGASGNYGYLDQTHALRWVQSNIAAFGGDRARVLLFGQSAGGYGVCMQIASPLARGLFSRAMMLSGGCSAMTQAVANSLGAGVATRLGCTSVECLRSKGLAELLAIPVNDGLPTSVTAGPVIDGRFLLRHPLESLGASTVPVVVSTTQDEYTNQLGLYGGSHTVSTPADYEQLVRQMFPTIADAVLARYPLRAYPSPNEALIALLSDANYICPARTASRQLARSGQQVWRAVFAHTLEQGPFQNQRAAHGFDLLFGFRNFLGYPVTAAERRLSDVVAGIWVRFAASGDTDWERYEPTRDNHLVIDQPLSTANGIRTAQCDFWRP